jgi:hypothetical protein
MADNVTSEDRPGPYRVCRAEGCGLELPCGDPPSSAFWGPDTGSGLCRLCQARTRGDKVIGTPAEPEPEGVPA